MSTPHDPTRSFSDLDQIIADYIQAEETGQALDRRDLIDRHPEQADALRGFFADLDRIDRVAAPLRDADPTEGPEAGPEDIPPIVRYFGDYEVMEEVARGGMGVVYKARQASLNRVVALKMILRGTFATDRDVARFRAEAESAANLDHPNIVPIFEVGEHDEQQYFSMKLIEGGPLSGRPRESVRVEVARIVAIARAVHFAHLRGILHRDLKPSNVLIDDRGVPFVTDFGLAKRLEAVDASLTESGQVLGTPRYMAPEQAAGRKDLTVAADIYSLGVILYERLTGRSPFVGENVLTLLRQVRETEPPRPSSIVPGLPRDLETIVLKCLAKEPSRRYESASSLADDLDRWHRGEPIEARPVGPFERGWLWCKRKPVVAALLATVAASLLIGIIGSTYFAINERRERRRAESAEFLMEGHLVRGLARPFDVESADEMSPPQLNALWDLAQIGDARIGLRLIDEATRDPRMLAGLRTASEGVMIAAVGLDPERRKAALDLLNRRIDGPGQSPKDRADIALFALELADGSASRSRPLTDAILAGLRARPSEVAGDTWPDVMTWELITSRLPPSDAAELLDEGVRRETNPYVRWKLIKDLTANITKRLDPSDAARELMGRFVQESKGDDRSILHQSLIEAAAHLPPVEATRVLLSNIDGKPDDPLNSVKALVAVAARLPRDESRHCLESALKILVKTLSGLKSPDSIGSTESSWQAIGIVAAQLDPADSTVATARCRQQIGRDRTGVVRVLFAELFHVAFHPVDELLAGGA